MNVSFDIHTIELQTSKDCPSLFLTRKSIGALRWLELFLLEGRQMLGETLEDALGMSLSPDMRRDARLLFRIAPAGNRRVAGNAVELRW